MNVNFAKSVDGLVPAVVQDAKTNKVLMVGFMNEEALERTLDERIVTFFSRSKGMLWTKGQETGKLIRVVDVLLDCDQDSILIKAFPMGPVCHLGTDTCWGEDNKIDNLQFLAQFQDFIDKRKREMPEGAYTTQLFNEGLRKICQKVGEEAVEMVVGAMANDDENFVYESADLLYHMIILLAEKGYRIEDLADEINKRHM